MRVLLMAICLFAILYSCKKEENGTTTLIPLSPTDLTGTVVSSSKIKLDWLDKSTNEDGFNIERKTTATSFAQIAKMGKDITSFTDSNLLSGTTYVYRVSAYNSAGSSITYTNEVNLSTYALPSITTISISDTMAKSATSGGTIASDGGSAIITKGIVWSTAANPTISLTTKTIDGSGNSSFASKISGLTANTKYYIRAYATNSAGTAYGNELSFTTNTIDLNSGLVAYYPFSGNAGDSSGNGNNGTNYGAELTTDRNNISNKAYLFNPNSYSYIKIPFSQSLNTIQNGLSISLWVLMDGGTDAIVPPRVLELRGINGGNAGFGLIALSNSNTSRTFEARWYNQNGNNNISISPTNPVTALTWHHIVYTADGNTAVAKFYVDNQLLNTNANSLNQGIINSCNYNNNELFIGADPNLIMRWGGKIDDIRIYNRVLTQSEINYLTSH